MKKIQKIDCHAYMLDLCRKILDDGIAIDDDAKIMLNKILEANSLSVVGQSSSDIEYLIDFIMYYEDIEPPGIGEDLISYVLHLNKQA